jgi:hypothetical protein
VDLKDERGWGGKHAEERDPNGNWQRAEAEGEGGRIMVLKAKGFVTERPAY